MLAIISLICLGTVGLVPDSRHAPQNVAERLNNAGPVPCLGISAENEAAARQTHEGRPPFDNWLPLTDRKGLHLYLIIQHHRGGGGEDRRVGAVTQVGSRPRWLMSFHKAADVPSNSINSLAVLPPPDGVRKSCAQTTSGNMEDFSSLYCPPPNGTSL